MAGKYIMILATLLFLCGCNDDGNNALSKSWKYSNGYHLGDLIYFDQVFKIKHDTIFRIDSAVATFRFSNNIFGRDELILTSISSGEDGVYTEFGNKMRDKIIIEQTPIDVEEPPEETTPEKPQP